MESYRATQPAGKDRVMSLLKQAAYSKNIEPETVEGALVYLESITAAGAQPQAHDACCIGSCHHQPLAQQARTSIHLCRNALSCIIVLHLVHMSSSTGACTDRSPQRWMHIAIAAYRQVRSKLQLPQPTSLH